MRFAGLDELAVQIWSLTLVRVDEVVQERLLTYFACLPKCPYIVVTNGEADGKCSFLLAAAAANKDDSGILCVSYEGLTGEAAPTASRPRFAGVLLAVWRILFSRAYLQFFEFMRAALVSIRDVSDLTYLFLFVPKVREHQACVVENRSANLPSFGRSGQWVRNPRMVA